MSSSARFGERLVGDHGDGSCDFAANRFSWSVNQNHGTNGNESKTNHRNRPRDHLMVRRLTRAAEDSGPYSKAFRFSADPTPDPFSKLPLSPPLRKARGGGVGGGLFYFRKIPVLS